MLAVALCWPSCLLQCLCSGPVQLCLLSVWPRSHWSAAVTGCPHLAQMCVSPAASRTSHALRRWRCAASYPLAVELPRCRSYARVWMAQKRVPCLTSCGQLCQAHLRRLMWPCRLPWAGGVRHVWGTSPAKVPQLATPDSWATDTTGVAAMVGVLRCDGSKGC